MRRCFDFAVKRLPCLTVRVREGLERRTTKDARSSLVAQVMVACSTPTVATDRAVAARCVTDTHRVAVS
mgnify:CR=1 FL=1